MTREAELELERLREALEQVGVLMLCGKKDHLPGRCDKASKLVIKALSTPPSTTALQSLIEKVERRTIERCAKECEQLRHTDGFSAESGDWVSGTIHAAYAIRALPTGNLKLEDL